MSNLLPKHPNQTAAQYMKECAWFDSCSTKVSSKQIEDIRKNIISNGYTHPIVALPNITHTTYMLRLIGWTYSDPVALPVSSHKLAITQFGRHINQIILDLHQPTLYNLLGLFTPHKAKVELVQYVILYFLPLMTQHKLSYDHSMLTSFIETHNAYLTS